MKSIMSRFLEGYNNNIIWILVLAIIALLLNYASLYQKGRNDNEEQEKFYCFHVVVRSELIQMLVEAGGIMLLALFLEETFQIKIFELLKIRELWKVYIGVFAIYHMHSGRKIYNRMDHRAFLRKVKGGKYSYTAPENIFQELIDEHQINYEMTVEKLNILKSIAPVSLIPIIAGVVLKGESLVVNWNWYTLVFFGILLLYFYSIWKSFKNIRFWKIEKSKIEKELRDYLSKKKEKEESLEPVDLKSVFLDT